VYGLGRARTLADYAAFFGHRLRAQVARPAGVQAPCAPGANHRGEMMQAAPFRTFAALLLSMLGAGCAAVAPASGRCHAPRGPAALRAHALQRDDPGSSAPSPRPSARGRAPPSAAPPRRPARRACRARSTSGTGVRSWPIACRRSANTCASAARFRRASTSSRF
jgi:hypothetical protein